MRRILQPTFLELTVLFLASNLFICDAHSQTADSLNVTTAGTSGSYVAMVYTAIPLSDGKILAGGSTIKFISSGGQSHTNLVRLNADGSVDDSFSASILGASPSAQSSVNCITLQTNGQILVGGLFKTINGQTHYNIGRLNADGTLDAGFNAGSADSSINCILAQADGKILVGGSFTVVNGQYCPGLCRLNYDGSLDTNFAAGANNSIMSIALQPDGKIVAEGKFTAIGGHAQTNLARLNTDGTLDTSFQPATITTLGSPVINGTGGTLTVQPDGKIIVGGMFDKVGGLSHTNVVRLNADGTLDTNFNAQADWHNCWGLQTVTLQTDGHILIGNDSLRLNGSPCPDIGRLTADGGLDPTFATNLVSGTCVFSSAVGPDGRILIAGSFSKLGEEARQKFGRLVNTDAATQRLSYDGTNILWLRGATSPEVWRTTFEASTNGADWTCLGEGLRTSGGWQLSNVPVSTSATIRARGFVTGGRFNGSSWFVESVYPQAVPIIEVNDGNFGFRSNQFGFNVSGSTGSTVIVDASSNLFDWSPVATNMLPSGPLSFSDPSSSNAVRRFYRARLQQ